MVQTLYICVTSKSLATSWHSQWVCASTRYFACGQAYCVLVEKLHYCHLWHLNFQLRLQHIYFSAQPSAEPSRPAVRVLYFVLSAFNVATNAMQQLFASQQQHKNFCKLYALNLLALLLLLSMSRLYVGGVGRDMNLRLHDWWGRTAACWVYLVSVVAWAAWAATVFGPKSWQFQMPF